MGVALGEGVTDGVGVGVALGEGVTDGVGVGVGAGVLPSASPPACQSLKEYSVPYFLSSLSEVALSSHWLRLGSVTVTGT